MPSYLFKNLFLFHFKHCWWNVLRFYILARDISSTKLFDTCLKFLSTLLRGMVVIPYLGRNLSLATGDRLWPAAISFVHFCTPTTSPAPMDNIKVLRLVPGSEQGVLWELYLWKLLTWHSCSRHKSTPCNLTLENSSM